MDSKLFCDGYPFDNYLVNILENVFKKLDVHHTARANDSSVIKKTGKLDKDALQEAIIFSDWKHRFSKGITTRHAFLLILYFFIT